MMAFGLTEVGIGVNAKKVRAYVEPDPATGGFRLFAMGDRNKLWITNATHGGLVGIVARIGKDGKTGRPVRDQLPERDIGPGAARTTSSGASRRTPAPSPRTTTRGCTSSTTRCAKDEQIQADGVEVLFYCLRMGRCMLAAMAAGYQRMFAADAAAYARGRDGVGGRSSSTNCRASTSAACSAAPCSRAR
jgi:alkylation response protein AidB-like acyl-CoA dehydrogenase